jgi:hypothetical protein
MICDLGAARAMSDTPDQQNVEIDTHNARLCGGKMDTGSDDTEVQSAGSGSFTGNFEILMIPKVLCFRGRNHERSHLSAIQGF